MDISVIICTHNRCDSLDNTLRSVETLIQENGLSMECIVVDNNSSDETRNLVELFTKKYPGVIRYTFEPRQGKSFALNKGIEEAKGNILAFSDDDVVFDRFWIKEIHKEFYVDSELKGVGGRVELYDETDMPITIRTSKERRLITRRSLDPRDIPIIGCNMAFVKNIFQKIGYFDTDLGPGTKIQAVSEDLDFIYRVCKGGHKIVYSPDILVYHNHGRKQDGDIKRLGINYLRGRGAFYCKHIMKIDMKIFRMLLVELFSISKVFAEDILMHKSTDRNKLHLKELMRGFSYKFMRLYKCDNRTSKH